MHLNNYRNRNEILIDWIIETQPQGSHILDIGANDGSMVDPIVWTNIRLS